MGRTDTAALLMQKGKLVSAGAREPPSGRAGRLPLGNHIPDEAWLSEEEGGEGSKQKEHV